MAESAWEASRRPGRGAIDPDEAGHRSSLHASAQRSREKVLERMDSIRADLSSEDLESAYETFMLWIKQEARYARADQPSHLQELVSTMLVMIEWMYARWPTRPATAGARASVEPVLDEI